MSDNVNSSSKGVLLVIGAYFVTVIVAIIFIVLATMIFIDTTKCSSLSRALPVLWGTIALVFLASIVVVRVIAWKVTPSTPGRWAIVVVYGISLLVSFVVIAFLLLIFFNC